MNAAHSPWRFRDRLAGRTADAIVERDAGRCLAEDSGDFLAGVAPGTDDQRDFAAEPPMRFRREPSLN
jgi:hypothetical protein